jgi:periplasmic protein CpxP/Spy
MKKDMFYRVVIIILLLLNTGTLGFVWVNNGKPKMERGHRPPRPDGIIIDRLQLDEQQKEQFFASRNEHHEHMVVIQRESSTLHKDLFALLQQPVVDTVLKDSILTRIQALNLRKEEVTFHHFQQLRSMLRPEQVGRFDELVEDISQQIMGPHRERKP